MKKYMLIVLLLGALTNANAAVKVTIVDLYATTYCAGVSFPITIFATDAFNQNNVFTAQLSDSTGSFNGGLNVNIGSVADSRIGLDTIWATIPAYATSGPAYRIRILGTNPVDTSADNGENLVIQPTPQTPFLSQWFGCPAQLAITGAGNNPYRITWLGYGTYQWLDSTFSSAYQPSTVAGGNGQGSGLNQLNAGENVFVDRHGNLYVVDGINERVTKFPPGSTSATNGTVVAGGNGQGGGANQLDGPTSVFVDGSGNIYVADLLNQRVQMFPAGRTSATNGVTVAGGNGFGNAANQLYDPQAIFVDGAGNLYVASFSRVQKFPLGSTSATAGPVVAGGNNAGSGANQLNSVSDLYVDAGGYIYVADEYNNRIQQFPPGGDSTTNAITVAGGNGQGTAANQFQSLWGVWLDNNGNIYASDGSSNAERVQLFPPNSSSATNGVTIAGGNGQGSGINQLSNPDGIFVDGSGNLYIADYGNYRIQKYTPTPPSAVDTPPAPGIWTASYGTWAGCPSAQTNYDTVGVCTAINEVTAQNNISLYPNPNTGSFTLNTAGAVGQTYIITDMVGRTIAEEVINSDREAIELNHISQGIYILAIKGSPGIRFTVE